MISYSSRGNLQIPSVKRRDTGWPGFAETVDWLDGRWNWLILFFDDSQQRFPVHFESENYGKLAGYRANFPPEDRLRTQQAWKLSIPKELTTAMIAHPWHPLSAHAEVCEALQLRRFFYSPKMVPPIQSCIPNCEIYPMSNAQTKR